MLTGRAGIEITNYGASTSQLLEIAIDAALQAGQMLASEWLAGRPEVMGTKSSPTDMVTVMDHRAETLIRGVIRKQRPGDVIIGEEGGETAGASTCTGVPVRWIVDPLDGTVNYVYGQHDWAVSVAVEVVGTVVVGVVDVPRRGETFTAVRGEGAFLHCRENTDPADVESVMAGTGRVGILSLPPGRPVRCTRNVPLEQALIATGFDYPVLHRQHQGRLVGALMPHIRDIRRSGSAAIDLCSVAAGRVDAYYERGLPLWDFAAGALIAQEAGARVGGISQGAGSTETLIAADAPLSRQLNVLLEILEARSE